MLRSGARAFKRIMADEMENWGKVYYVGEKMIGNFLV